MWCLCVKIHKQCWIKEEEINVINIINIMRILNLPEKWENIIIVEIEISNSIGWEHVAGAIIVKKSD